MPTHAYISTYNGTHKNTRKLFFKSLCYVKGFCTNTIHTLTHTHTRTHSHTHSLTHTYTHTHTQTHTHTHTHIHTGLCTRTFVPKTPGRLVLEFDNSYSYLRSKTVRVFVRACVCRWVLRGCGVGGIHACNKVYVRVFVCVCVGCG
jgi:hypothetical protein